MEYEIKRIDILSVVKIFFFLFLIIGFIMSLVYFVFMNMASGFLSNFSGEELEIPAGVLGGFVSLFGIMFFSVMYAIFMSVFTAIILGLYNIMAHYIGGIKATFKPGHISGQTNPVLPEPPSE